MRWVEIPITEVIIFSSDLISFGGIDFLEKERQLLASYRKPRWPLQAFINFLIKFFLIGLCSVTIYTYMLSKPWQLQDAIFSVVFQVNLISFRYVFCILSLFWSVHSTWSCVAGALARATKPARRIASCCAHGRFHFYDHSCSWLVHTVSSRVVPAWATPARHITPSAPWCSSC